jgi:hypothetical protein
MNQSIVNAYRKLRTVHTAMGANGRPHLYRVPAEHALREAHIRAEWREWEGRGLVRMRVEPDYIAHYDDLAGDSFNFKVNPDIPAFRLERMEEEFKERISRDGVWGIISEWFNGTEWQHADSCWGFVGDDWQDSGYDVDAMAQAISAAKAHYDEPAQRLDSVTR